MRRVSHSAGIPLSGRCKMAISDRRTAHLPDRVVVFRISNLERCDPMSPRWQAFLIVEWKGRFYRVPVEYGWPAQLSATAIAGHSATWTFEGATPPTAGDMFRHRLTVQEINHHLLVSFDQGKDASGHKVPPRGLVGPIALRFERL